MKSYFLPRFQVLPWHSLGNLGQGTKRGKVEHYEMGSFVSAEVRAHPQAFTDHLQR